jgi:3-phenylpropionate/trans-cinnamate dioxygenase ferredoxin reductase component
VSAYDVVVIGAGPAGHSAAAAYREAGGRGSVLLLAGEGHAPYERPPLSKELLRGEAEVDALPLEDPGFYREQGIEVRPTEAIWLDAERRVVTLAGGESPAFGRCVLATGAQPVRPPIPGADLPGVHVLRTVGHALALRAAAGAGTPALVLGSGFIGCEAAVSLARRGCRVTLVSQEPAPQAERLGDAVAERLAGWLEQAGVDLRFERELARLDRRGDGLRATLSGGDEVDAGLVLLAAGVAPDASLAEAAGLDLADSGEVAADAALRTSVPAVLACGDCCRAEHAVAGRPLHVEHWGDALAQGEIAGRTAAGVEAAWATVPGFWSTIGERTLKYAAWGDGYDDTRLVDHGDGAFTAWYARDGACVGVLAHDRDDDYESGRERIERREPPP